MSESRLGVCNLCEAICGLQVTVDGGVVTGIRGNPDDPLSRGHICPKGVALADVHADPDRLRRPVRRVGRGAAATWQEIGWDEALDLVAEGLAGAVERGGRDAVAVYLGNPNVHSVGFATHGTTLVRTLRTRNKFSATSVDQMPHQLVAWQLYGHQLLLPIPDIDRTSWFLVLGANPMASNGSLMTVPDFPARLRALRERGGRMVVLDPRRTETAKVADEHHFVRPGSDVLVLLAMLHVLVAEGLATPPSYVDGVERVAELVAPYTPELAARHSGVPADVVRRLTRELAAADGAAVYGRMGLSTQGFGTLCQWAVQLLNVLTGNLDREGGTLLTEPAADTVGLRAVGPGHFGAWHSRVRGLPEFAGELPVAALREEIETPGEGQVRALLTVAGNPVLSTPDGRALGEALEGLEFMAAIDIYLNETTRHADVVLPTTTALERDHYDLVFHALAVRNTARWTPAVLAAAEDARHDWQVYAELAVRLQERFGVEPRRDLLTYPPRQAVSDLLDATGRTSLAELEAHPEGVDLGPLRPTLPGRLQTDDGRIDLAPALVTDDLERVRATFTEAPAAPGDGQLLLVGRRHQRDCNSWLHNTTRLTRGRPRHHLLMHPDDLAARGLADGARVVVTSRVGTVETEVAAVDDMMPGVVSLPHGYGHQVPGTRLGIATAVVGASVNDLTDPDRLDVSGNAALNGLPVTVRAASPA
ncbi:molybdopterin-dependent oxidoreductase [Nocardioides sp. SYSU D00038]|uniref:molybdopterin-dependent oxidoreductase n=1 Tax=Nocardioides sp. SYSU D00038 TaxID=2812554 RepID=UPI0019682716|nr:molybdopterin-dependent oxidoreductase [Nocardioides sp. SYSU D00038]